MEKLSLIAGGGYGTVRGGEDEGGLAATGEPGQLSCAPLAKRDRQGQAEMLHIIGDFADT